MSIKKLKFPFYSVSSCRDGAMVIIEFLSMVFRFE